MSKHDDFSLTSFHWGTYPIGLVQSGYQFRAGERFRLPLGDNNNITLRPLKGGEALYPLGGKSCPALSWWSRNTYHSTDSVVIFDHKNCTRCHELVSIFGVSTVGLLFIHQ